MAAMKNGVKVNSNGSYTVTSKEGAVKALKMMNERSEEAQALMAEHGISELMQEATELKKAATAFCVAKGVEKLDLGDQYATLREDGYDRRWILDDDEITDESLPVGVVSLHSIIVAKYGNELKVKGSKARKLWMKITKRVVDAEALQEAVDRGDLDEDEIEPAFVEKKKAPYLRLYPKG